jgi:hypothetical protein
VVKATAAGSDDKAKTDAETDKVKEIESRYERLYSIVPELGEAWRWYDIPYRVMRRLRDSWIGRRIPVTARVHLARAMSFFMAFDHFDRLKAELPTDTRNLIAPGDEHVTQGGLWILELFPPSRYSSLRESLEKNGWDRDRHITGIYETNVQNVATARRTAGYSWFRLGEISGPGRTYPWPDAKRETLPPEFSKIEVSAVQLGRGLTAVVAFVEFTKLGENAVDQTWRQPHEPRLHWQGFRRPLVEDRYFSGIRTTQSERMRLHDAARDWLRQACPGFFADTQAGHPIIDFNLLTKFDPATTDPSSDLDMMDNLRALGMDGNPVYRYETPAIKGAVLVDTDSSGGPSEVLRNCWAILGRHDAISDMNRIWMANGPGPHSPQILARQFGSFAEGFLVQVGTLQYADELRAVYASSRDEARSRYRRFNLSSMEHLRGELLSASLDLPVVKRDVSTLGSSGRIQAGSVTVRAVPWEPGGHGYDVIELFDRIRTTEFSALVDEDSDYRDVLSTVAAIGSSADASRLGRLALVVSCASLVVALVTLLVADIGDLTLWSLALQSVLGR